MKKETSFENNITCPYCGYEDLDSWEVGADDGERECGRCEKMFLYERHISVTYSTQGID